MIINSAELLSSREKLSDIITSSAVWAMMSEVAITPKPGLVDRANSGSHKDMDFFSFIDSASALLPWFRYCALAGFDSAKDKIKTPQNLFESLRPPGREAEVLMKKATGGVNVHRGYIFCFGLISAAYGRLYHNAEKPELTAVLNLVRGMTEKLGEDFSSPNMRLNTKEASHGEKIYFQSGISGIRGEAAKGFPSVTEHALPLLRAMLKGGNSLNDAGIAALLKLLAHAEDTNIIHRGGIAALKAIQEDLKSFFAGNKMPGERVVEALREKAAALDREFIAKNLSPGGSADLLGVTLFLYKLMDIKSQNL